MNLWTSISEISFRKLLHCSYMVIVIFVARSQKIFWDISNFMGCQGEKWKIKIAGSFSAIKMCFVIIVLNNKAINYPAKSCRKSPDCSQLRLRPCWQSIRWYSTRFCRIIVKYSKAILHGVLIQMSAYPCASFLRPLWETTQWYWRQQMLEWEQQSIQGLDDLIW